jgi:ATP-dependent Lon protease
VKKPRSIPELSDSKLRWRCPRDLGFRTTAELDSKPEIIGQPRALAALQLGLEIDSPGYNIFVVGLTGTGKTTTITRLFEKLKLIGEIPDDLCYVHNFRRPDEPRAIQLPSGRGCEFQRDMRELVDYIRGSLPQVYESEEYQTRHRKTVEIFKKRGRSIFKDFEAQVSAEKFRIVQIQMGALTHAELHAVVGEEAFSIDKLKDLTDEGRFDRNELQRLQETYNVLSQGLQNTLQEGRRIETQLRESLRKLGRHFAALVIREPIRELRDKYSDVSRVEHYLEAVEEHVLDSLAKFVRSIEGQAEAEEDGTGTPPPELFEFEVNVVVDNSEAKGPPIVVESSPTYRSLFGSVDYQPQRSGVWHTDFTHISAGSLLAANGGYLVFNLHDVQEPGVWPTLKRVLKNRKAEIRPPQAIAGIGASTLKPEPVALDVKVVLIGDSYSYHMLHAYDDEFRKIFKVKADFDSTMARTRRSLRQYAGFLAQLAHSENLPAFDASGVATIIEAGARLAGRQDRLSTRFSDIADVAREAAYWARKNKARLVKAEHVDRALQERENRVNLMEERVQRSIDEGVLLLDVRGRKLGQVNGITVYDVGDHAFGRPARITSEVSLGRSGIINIEREANLSGSTHDKGVLILAGYLRGKYAQHRPLTLSASIAFEQSYGGVDGDSASAAELFVLVSAIGGIPLRQDLGVTGSINQKGEMQPIGGINEKIEGFFDTCKARGLTGTQGVVFPHQNAAELMLRKEIVEAVHAGKFHLYAIRSVDQGLELLTDCKAGRRTRSGYERDTVHGVVDEALAKLAEEIKEYVESTDTATGRSAGQGLSDEEEDEGVELRRRRRLRQPWSAMRRKTGASRRRHA